MADVGRPKITLEDFPEGWQQSMEDYAKEGKSELSIRINVLNGICHETWERLIKEDETFSETVKRCRALTQDWWEEVGRKGAVGEQDINPTTWIFNMKNRFGWADKRQLEHSGGMSVNINAEDSGVL